MRFIVLSQPNPLSIVIFKWDNVDEDDWLWNCDAISSHPHTNGKLGSSITFIDFVSIDLYLDSVVEIIKKSINWFVTIYCSPTDRALESETFWKRINSAQNISFRVQEILVIFLCYKINGKPFVFLRTGDIICQAVFYL